MINVFKVLTRKRRLRMYLEKFVEDGASVVPFKERGLCYNVLRLHPDCFDLFEECIYDFVDSEFSQTTDYDFRCDFEYTYPIFDPFELDINKDHPKYGEEYSRRIRELLYLGQNGRQFDFLDKYSGRQLELRKRMCQWMINNRLQSII